MTEEERGARARDVLKEYAYETPKKTADTKRQAGL